jgi:hypothetical protein
MSNRAAKQQDAFIPGLVARDEIGSYWLRQAMWRLRREVAWLWHERGWTGAEPPSGLPQPSDRLVAALDHSRYAEQKHHFFATNVAAAYLSDRIAEEPQSNAEPERGSFGWVAQTLALSDVAVFTLALALVPVIDSASGSVIAACLNDTARQLPTLALVQRLWDAPAEVIGLMSPTHALYRHGLLAAAPASWETALTLPGAVAEVLLWGESSVRSDGSDGSDGPDRCQMTLARLRSAEARGSARLMPLIGPRDLDLQGAAAKYAAALGLPLLAPALMPGQSVAAVATEAWLRGALLYLPLESLSDAIADTPISWPMPALPVTAIIGMNERSALRRLPEALRIAEVVLPAASYEERLALWQETLPHLASEDVLAEAARRFRYGPERIRGIARDLAHLPSAAQAADVLTACRADIDLGSLAQPVITRFKRSDLKLPQKQSMLIDGLIHAMQQLTTVHYQWGTARPWNEAGLSALFAGPPGTGKTMAAEVVAAELQLPLYRIDLSQVVNKYIGETEKNLRRLFDTAEESDAVLFFDEADAIFGKRTEVRDSHDRYANLEISYLLERMERFKGLAILATNRRKDLDEAFMRRLRWVIEFEMPEYAERLALWQQCRPDPAKVDSSSLDLASLAERFALSGGHIRSIMLNACLYASQPGGRAVLTMPHVLHAARQEYEKIGRIADATLFDHA